MLHTTGALTCTDLTFRQPDGTTVLDGVTFGLEPGRYGIIGDNGVGKSTLLKLISGELRPTSGSVHVTGELEVLAQDPATEPDQTVAGVLGVADTLAALRRIESGSVDEQDFEMVGADWDVDERLRAMLARLRLEGIALDRRLGTLSGGELMLLSLTALLMRRPEVLLLDEPTNNLDAQAQHRLHDAVMDFPGTLIVVSHDRQLLESLDSLGELRDQSLRWYGGGLSFYEQVLTAEQHAAAQSVATARSDVRRQRRELSAQVTRQARRDKAGRASADSMPTILAGTRRRRAQETAGRVRAVHRARVESAQQTLERAEQRLREDDEIRLDLPATCVPGPRDVLRATGLRSVHSSATLDLTMRGPERVGLTGPNGVGKTALLRCLTEPDSAAAGDAEILVPHRLLPQNLRMLDPELSILENVTQVAPDADPTRIRHQLALFLLRGDAVHHPAGTLSGGELWRATLATLLLAEPAPQLLILDEPTNNLDFTSMRHLVQASRSFQGALLVVSHDEHFLTDLGLDRRIDLTSQEGPHA